MCFVGWLSISVSSRCQPKLWSCAKICCGREDSKICTAFGLLSGRDWLWSTVHVVGLSLKFFNDSCFGPYSCLSFNAKQKLLFRSNCCFGTNRSRHQFCLWVSQLCLFQSEIPSLGYCWHLAVAVLYRLLMLPLLRYSCTHSGGILLGSCLSDVATFFFLPVQCLLLPAPAFGPPPADTTLPWLLPSLTFSALLTHCHDSAPWLHGVPSLCRAVS